MFFIFYLLSSKYNIWISKDQEHDYNFLRLTTKYKNVAAVVEGGRGGAKEWFPQYTRRTEGLSTEVLMTTAVVEQVTATLVAQHCFIYLPMQPILANVNFERRP